MTRPSAMGPLFFGGALHRSDDFDRFGFDLLNAAFLQIISFAPSRAGSLFVCNSQATDLVRSNPPLLFRLQRSFSPKDEILVLLSACFPFFFFSPDFFRHKDPYGSIGSSSLFVNGDLLLPGFYFLISIFPSSFNSLYPSSFLAT